MNTSLYDNGITVFAFESDCLADAPEPYGSLMLYLHFLTIPLYALSIYVLTFKVPISLRDYGMYLLWNTVGNLVFELFVSIFMLPVTHLPHLVLRCAGILKYWNFSGLFQTIIFGTALHHTSLTILEMFKYRLNTVVREETFGKKLIHKVILVYWIISTILLVLLTCAVPLGLPNQHKLKQKLWESLPDKSSTEILCYNSYIVPPFELIFPFIMFIVLISFIASLFVIGYTTGIILAKLEEMSKHFSRKTIELQKMLLVSLVIQALIHFVMLSLPVGGFLDAVYFSLPDNDVANILLFLLSFHGSFSTIAMIVFTQPIRHGLYYIIGQLYRPLSLTRAMKIVSIHGNEFTTQFRKPASKTQKSINC